MKIAILGAGNVGGTLGKRFAEIGYEIFYGVRNPANYENKGLNGKVGTIAESAKEAEIILLSVPYNAVSETIKSCGDISGKIIIDATNPLGMTEKGLGLTLGFETSGGEKVQEIASEADVVKCFNQVGANILGNPNNSMMFVCGNNLKANETVKDLAVEIGFEAINIGDLSKARLLEPLAALWIHLAFTSELKRNFTFEIQKN